MIRIRFVMLALLAAALVPGVSVNRDSGWQIQSAYAQENAVRPEVGNPLKAAYALIKAQKPHDALAKISEADGVSGKTANETYLINQMRFSAASAAGEADTAAKAFDALVASGRMPAAEQAKHAESLAEGYYRAKDYAKAIQWFMRVLRDSPGNGQARTLLAQSYYQNNECGKATAEVNGMIQAETSAGHPPAESQLDILASCYSKQKDNAGMFAVLEKQLVYFPKKEYWYEALNRVQRKPGYAGRLDLDVFRLRLVTFNLHSAADYMEMTQLALQTGATAEAKKIVDLAYASGALGSGPDAERQKRLRDLVTKSVTEAQQSVAQREADAAAAKDGLALVNAGYDIVASGRYDKGIQLMEQGIRKDSLKYPEDAKLHLGIAFYLAGQKSKAIDVFKTVRGTDGTADLARLWIIQSGR
jgi:tetratricopeptide (TPR) repeat protein